MYIVQLGINFRIGELTMCNELKNLLKGKILTEEDLTRVYEQLDEVGNKVACILLCKIQLEDSSLVFIITRKALDYSMKLQASERLFVQDDSPDNCRIILKNLTDMPDKDSETLNLLLEVGRKLLKDNNRLEDAYLCADCGIDISQLYQC